MGRTEHHAGEAYSQNNPVPTVKGHEAEVKARQQDENAKQKEASGQSSEKQQMMDKMAGPKGKPNDRLEIKGERTVLDPVTGTDVRIRDASLSDNSEVQTNHVDPKVVNERSSSLQPVRDPSAVESINTSPSPAIPANICLQPFPPPVDSKAMMPFQQRMQGITYTFLGGLAVLWFFTAFGHGAWTFTWRTSAFAAVGGLAFVQFGVMSNQVVKELERVRWEMHRQRGEKHSPPTPESTEWLNAFIATFMGLLNPEFFLPIADQIEDVMQASLPALIDAVKISDLGIGTNPFRIVSMRALPDQPGDKGYPKEEWIDLGDADKKREKEKQEKKDAENKVEQELGKKEEFTDQSGDYINFEVAFAYQARPGQSDALRAHNIHLMIQFFIGVYDWLHIPIPIWIQVEGLVGTVRLRMQMIPEMPYVRNLTFTMMGVPKIAVSAKPMVRKLPNILDLPLVSGFVQSSIAAGLAEFVAPKSMTINLQEMLSGAAATESTRARGVIVVTIHHATDLSAQDSNGKSDPYIVMAYAKFGKPLYSTRIIKGDLNPVFEETAFLLLSDDEIKSHEELSIMLWDSDERSADDLVGRVQLPVSELLENPNKTRKRTDKLKGYEEADQMRGELTWSVGYFEKVHLQPARQENLLSDAEHTAAGPGQPAGPMMPAKVMEAKPTNTPPSPQYPAGILSLVVHHINNLERANLKGATGKETEEGSAGQDVSEPTDQDDNLPSSYCEFIVGDQMVYKTRVKQYTTQPFFEAGTEVFIRDWRDTVVRIAVRDSRVREKDPLLGVVNIDLERLFEVNKSSSVTQLFSLQEGVGFGRAHISVLFQAVDAGLPKNLLGWNTATVEIRSPVVFDCADELGAKYMKQKLKLITNEDTIIVPARDATMQGGNVEWNVQHDGAPMRLPVFERYKSALIFEVGGREGLLGSNPDVFAALWLSTIPDDHEQEVRIPLIQGKNLRQLRQHFINKQLETTHDYTVCGYLKCKVFIDPGLDPDHAKYAKSNVARHEFEAYDNSEGQAEQAQRNSHANDDGVIDKKEQKALDDAKQKALESRHRGKMQHTSVRTSVWMTQGLQKRARSIKTKITGRGIKEPHVPSEAKA